MSKFKEGDLVILNIGDNSVHSHNGKRGIVSLVRSLGSGIDYLVVSRDKMFTFGYHKSEYLVLDTQAIRSKKIEATLSQPTVDNLSDLSEDPFYEIWDEMPPKAPWMTETDAVKPCGTHNVPIKDAGLQTHIEARFDCVDPVVMKLLAECRGFGVNKYGKHSHKKIPVSDHLNHAINHINEHRRNDKSELHLVNAICRLMFAISQLHEQGQYVDTYWHPDMLPKPAPGEKNE
jgi:hypothetical protein